MIKLFVIIGDMTDLKLYYFILCMSKMYLFELL